MNEIIRNLTIENFLNLKASFDTSKKIFWDEEKNRLVHAGEYGIYREELIRKWLRMYIPKRFEISSGFLINSENKISSQCDIVIYDRDNTPQIESQERQRFFPVETVAIVIEVKSDINSVNELNTHLEKLSEIKKLREDVKNPIPYYRRFDGNFDLSTLSFDISTFLICNKLNFDLTNNPISYASNKKYKHNLILSLHDGLISYWTPDGMPNVPIPFVGDELSRVTFVENDNKELPTHIGLFLHALHVALGYTTLLEIDLSYYLSDNYIEESQLLPLKILFPLE